GVTTVEVKSGYGLTTADECKLLEVVAGVGQGGWQRGGPTFLGAHAVPGGDAGNRGAYIDLVCARMLPGVARRGLARFCGGGCGGSGTCSARRGCSAWPRASGSSPGPATWGWG